MALTLTSVRFYTAADPYLYSVDNRPLSDLETRDNELQAELERRTLAVDITGSATPTINRAPAGWTVALNGTGDYTITHGIGNTNYVAQLTVVDAAGGFADVQSFTSTTIRIVTRTTAGAAAHKRFHLTIIGY